MKLRFGRPAIAPADPRRRRLLVCDDERHIARLIRVKLERQGYTVVCVFDGQAAIEQLQTAGVGDETTGFDRARRVSPG